MVASVIVNRGRCVISAVDLSDSKGELVCYTVTLVSFTKMNVA